VSGIAARVLPGETVAVIAGDGIVRVEVTDFAGEGTPELLLGQLGFEAESGLAEEHASGRCVSTGHWWV
jgi:hypothetical protein